MCERVSTEWKHGERRSWWVGGTRRVGTSVCARESVCVCAGDRLSGAQSRWVGGRSLSLSLSLETERRTNAKGSRSGWKRHMWDGTERERASVYVRGRD